MVTKNRRVTEGQPVVQRVLLAVLSLVLAGGLAAAAPNTPGPASESIPYTGRINDSSGKPLNGIFDMSFRFIDAITGEEVLVDSHSRVQITRGAFEVALGCGDLLDGWSKGRYASLAEVLRDFPDLYVQVEAEGTFYQPWIRVASVGQSPSSRYQKWLEKSGGGAAPLLTGGPIRIGGNEDPKDPLASHWKGWKTPSSSTSAQAVVLEPAPGGGGGAPPSSGVYDPAPTFQKGPMLADVIGPYLSRPVRELPVAPEIVVARDDSKGKEINPPRHGSLYDAEGHLFGTRTSKVLDPLVDFAGVAGADSRTPDPLVQWQGQSIGPYLPPDTEGDVGDTHYVQVINVAFKMWYKDGTQYQAARNTNTLWTGFGGPCASDNDGDAIIMYDSFADRWVITQFAVSSGECVCFAVSQTSDPAGSYYLYQVNTQRFPDYFKLGVWPDPQNNAYFMGTNSGYQNQYDVYAIDRERMLTGATARSAQFFQGYANLMMPADADGDAMPPAGSPGYFYTFYDGGESYFNNPPNDQLVVYAFDVDWNTPAYSTMTLRTTINEGAGPGQLASFNWTLCGFFTQCCLPQPGTSTRVDSASWWPMKRLQYRNLPDGREAMVGCWTVDVDGGGNRAGVRWFELNKSGQTPGGGWTLYQQGTYSPDATNRWMPSIAMDQSGNVALGYSVGNSSSIYPSIRYASRLATDTLGTLGSEKTLWTGTSAQTSSSCRWGDYSAMNVDPADDCTFWYTNEYISSGTWTTRIGAFKMTECGCLSVPPALSIGAANNGDNRIDVTWPDSTTASITKYWVKRSDTAGGPYTQVAEVADSSPGVGGSGTYTWSDTTVSGGSTYYYVVYANDGVSCTSPVSNEVGVTAQGACLLAPTFAGLASVTNPGAAACTLNLSWAAGTARCSGPLAYNIYRSTTTGFTPGPGNQIVTALAANSYQDFDQLVMGTRYYYVVRAVDTSNGTEEANTVEKSGVPTGVITASTLDDTFEGSQSPGGFDLAGWSHNYVSGTTDWTYNNSVSQSPTHSWFAQDVGSVSDKVLVTPSFGVLNITELTFYHRYAFEGSTSTCYDGGTLEYAEGPGFSTWNQITGAMITLNGYTGTINTGWSNPLGGKPAFCGSQASFVQVIVNLSSLDGKTIKVRWHEGDDSSTTGTGWYVDTIQLKNVGTAGTCTSGAMVNPKEASPSHNMSCSKDSGTSVSVTYAPACGATDHVAYWTKMTSGTISSALSWENAACGLGASSPATFDPGAVNGGEWVYFVLVGQNATKEGSYGTSGAGVERPEASNAAWTCNRPQDLSGTCP